MLGFGSSELIAHPAGVGNGPSSRAREPLNFGSTFINTA